MATTTDTTNFFPTRISTNNGTYHYEPRDKHLEVFHMEEGVLKAATHLYGLCYVHYEFKWGSSWLDSRSHAKVQDRMSPLRTMARLIIKDPGEDIVLVGFALCSESDPPSIPEGMKTALSRLKNAIEDQYDIRRKEETQPTAKTIEVGR